MTRVREKLTAWWQRCQRLSIFQRRLLRTSSPQASSPQASSFHTSAPQMSAHKTRAHKTKVFQTQMFERHRSRQGLKHLDARLLRDIGLTEADAQKEQRKPIWK